MKEKYNVDGVAISALGAVDSKMGVIGGITAIPYIHGLNFKEILRESTNLNIEMEGDANCAALGECWLGAGSDRIKGCALNQITYRKINKLSFLQNYRYHLRHV
jgi:Transcriptional regulator/sugar kinase